MKHKIYVLSNLTLTQKLFLQVWYLGTDIFLYYKLYIKQFNSIYITPTFNTHAR